MYTIRIMFMSGPEDGTEYWLSSNQNIGYAAQDGWAFTIGRRESCDLVIPFDTQISREHARIRLKMGGIWLEDANSRNGTFLENKRIFDPTALAVGDLFRVGYTWLRLEEASQP